MPDRVVVAPHFRGMAEIFDDATRHRLTEIADVVWARDEPMPPEAFAAALGDASAVVFGTWHYGRKAIPAAGPNLRAVLEVAGGHNHPDLDYEHCLDRGILVGSCAPAFGPVVAEMALALTLAATRGVAESDRAFRAGAETYLHDGNDGRFSLYGRTVGFVGCGGLARGLQPLLAPFGVTVLGYDPWLADAELEARGIEPCDLGELFARSAVVYVLAVPTPENRGMIDRSLMERLGGDDALVLISRAHLVDFAALTDMVVAGRFRAGIDVFPAEPVAADHPIRDAGNAVLTAHLAGALPEALHEIGRMVVDDLTEILAGRPPQRMQYARRSQPPQVGVAS